MRKKTKNRKIVFSYQTFNDRSPFSDECVISSCLKKDKKGINQSTKLILGISNWHFNRDTQHLVEAPQCKVEDVNISLKFASTAFNAEETGGAYGRGQTASTSAASSTVASTQLKFDKNGVTIPYVAFVYLLEQESFHQYMVKIRTLYEQKEGKTTRFDDAEETEEMAAPQAQSVRSEEEESLASKKKKNVVSGSGKRKRKAAKIVSDDETVIEEDEVLFDGDVNLLHATLEEASTSAESISLLDLTSQDFAAQKNRRGGSTTGSKTTKNDLRN